MRLLEQQLDFQKAHMKQQADMMKQQHDMMCDIFNRMNADVSVAHAAGALGAAAPLAAIATATDLKPKPVPTLMSVLRLPKRLA